VWKQLADRAEAEKGALYKHYEGKALYTGLLHLYAEIHQETNETLLWEEAKSNKEFHKHRRRKQNIPDGKCIQAKESNNDEGIRNPRVLSQVPTWNCFAPLEHRLNLRAAKKTQTMVTLANSSRYFIFHGFITFKISSMAEYNHSGK
jgi:hypothetical protein